MGQKDRDDREINQIGVFFGVVGTLFLIAIFVTDSPVKHLFMNIMN